MTESTEATDSATDRQANEKAAKAMLDLISDAVAEIRSNNFSLVNQAHVAKDLAYAYRLVIGGPQPGGSQPAK